VCDITISYHPPVNAAHRKTFEALFANPVPASLWSNWGQSKITVHADTPGDVYLFGIQTDMEILL
jgi:hypothetical protein